MRLPATKKPVINIFEAKTHSPIPGLSRDISNSSLNKNMSISPKRLASIIGGSTAAKSIKHLHQKQAPVSVRNK